MCKSAHRGTGWFTKLRPSAMGGGQQQLGNNMHASEDPTAWNGPPSTRHGPCVDSTTHPPLGRAGPSRQSNHINGTTHSTAHSIEFESPSQPALQCLPPYLSPAASRQQPPTIPAAYLASRLVPPIRYLRPTASNLLPFRRSSLEAFSISSFKSSSRPPELSSSGGDVKPANPSEVNGDI